MSSGLLRFCRYRRASWPTSAAKSRCVTSANQDALLPDELRTELPNARITRVGDISEVCAADIPTRVRELRVVEYVKEFTANLEGHGFPNGNDLRYSEIRVIETRAMEEPPVRGPETSAIRTGQNTRRR